MMPRLSGGAKDPDDFVREYGVEAFKAELARAKPLMDVLWRRETRGADISTPERRAALEKRIEALVDMIGSKSGDTRIRAHYRMEYRKRLRLLFSGKAEAASPHMPRIPANQVPTLDLAVIGMCRHAPATAAFHAEEILQLDGVHPEVVAAVRAIATISGELKAANSARAAKVMNELRLRSIEIEIADAMDEPVPDAGRVMALVRDRDALRLMIARAVKP